MTLNNFRTRVTAKDGILKIDPAIADLYSGEYRGTLTVDVTRKRPKIRFEQTLQAVQAGTLLADLADAANLEGLLEAKMTGGTRGRTTNGLVRNMRADLSFDLADGLYKGVDVWYEIRKARNRIRGKPLPERPAREETPITALGFNGRVADGLLTSDTLNAEIPFIRLNGNGVLDILKQNIDYRLNARVLSRPEFPDGDDLSDLEKLVIPLRISGSIAEPGIAVDLAELGKGAAVQELQDRLLKKLGGEDSAGADGNGEEAGAETAPESDRDALKRSLRGLFD